MPATSKNSGKTPQASPDERTLAVTEESESSRSVAVPARDVGSRILHGGEFVLSSVRSPGGRRIFGWITLAIIVVLVVGSFGTWVRYESKHITSTNAIVRGHLGEIGTQLDGIVTKVEVDSGDRVLAGQVLIRLDDRQFQAEVRESRAIVNGLERELEVEGLAIEHERRQIEQQIQESSANLRAAEAKSAAAKFQAEDSQRFHTVRAALFASGGAISGEEVLDAETNWRMAEALYNATQAEEVAAASAQDKARLAGDALPIRERGIGVLEAQLLQAQAQLSKADTNLESATIRAPEDGAIVRRIVQMGGSVETGQPIISMWLGSDVWIEAWVDEEDIADVALGSPATVTLQSFPESEFIGSVDKIGLTTDFEMPDSEIPQPRFSRMRGAPVVGVRIKLNNPPAKLLPGLSAVVAIQRRSR